MIVQDLIDEIERCKREYGDDFLGWVVYTEQINEMDKRTKIDGLQKGWGRVVGDENGDEWEYFECAGFWTRFPNKKIFTVNVNY